ncbi:MAG TPA: hypothetical protein VHD90_00335, partial [Phototrophicaceae bacterium]|nr:hypothetical protein [Phototrophicaceae bacterium]
MGRMIRIAIGTLAIVAMISIGAFLYLTRGISAPTEAAAEAVTQLSASDNSTTQTVFRISADDSTAEYTITEVLNGSPKTVVGTTSEVAGDILVNLSDPAASTVGEIAINARTFATDDSRRDNSVARFILQSESDANQFIDFTPTIISGLT